MIIKIWLGLSLICAILLKMCANTVERQILEEYPDYYNPLPASRQILDDVLAFLMCFCPFLHLGLIFGFLLAPDEIIARSKEILVNQWKSS